MTLFGLMGLELKHLSHWGGNRLWHAHGGRAGQAMLPVVRLLPLPRPHPLWGLSPTPSLAILPTQDLPTHLHAEHGTLLAQGFLSRNKQV